MKRIGALPWGLSLVMALPLAGLASGAAHAATDYQAEDAVVTQGAVATNHTGYTGTGFVDYTNVKGSAVEFTVAAAAAGTASVDAALRQRHVRRPADGHLRRRDGRRPGHLVPGDRRLGHLGDATVDVPLTAGANKIRADRHPANGGPNLDRIGVGRGRRRPGAHPAGTAELLRDRRGPAHAVLGRLDRQRRA